ncbi:MAG: M28 family peptidase [Anaerolineae bacterium]|nr:M28 family peptidase [Anaerolineae bacterium]MDQ7033876.1 M28 family peptidase [Anaerolineae bacterium]
MLDAYFKRLITDTTELRCTSLLAILDKMGASYHVDKEKVGQRKAINIRVPLHNNVMPYILIGAHYDSPPDSSGANDNVAGLSVLLGILRVFHFITKQKRRPIPLEFVFFDMGEDEMIGSSAYTQHIHENQIYAMLNLDLCGVGDTVLLAAGDHVPNTPVDRALRKLNESPHKSSLRVIEMLPPGDDYYFNRIGVATVSICIVPEDDIVPIVGVAVSMHNNEHIAILPSVFETIHNRALDKPEVVDIDAMRQVMLVVNNLISNLFLTMPEGMDWR